MNTFSRHVCAVFGGARDWY